MGAFVHWASEGAHMRRNMANAWASCRGGCSYDDPDDTREPVNHDRLRVPPPLHSSTKFPSPVAWNEVCCRVVGRRLFIPSKMLLNHRTTCYDISPATLTGQDHVLPPLSLRLQFCEHASSTMAGRRASMGVQARLRGDGGRGVGRAGRRERGRPHKADKIFHLEGG